MDADEAEIESLQQRHAELVEEDRMLHAERAQYIEDETRKRTKNRDGFSGSFSASSVHKLDPDHPRLGHLDPDRVEKINEVLEEVSKADKYRTLTGEMHLKSRKMDQLWNEITELLIDEGESKKSNIGAIWSVFGTDVDKRRLVDAVDCHKQYPARLMFNEESGEVEYKDRVKRRKQNQVRPDQRKEILARDDFCCVRCSNSEEEKLVVHHIIPVSQGGTAEDENLATLCEECHDEAHDHSSSGDVIYGDRDGFEVWIEGATRGLESKQGRLSEF